MAQVDANIQNKFNRPNMIYKVTKDYDLGGNTLTIPAGCTLDFQGGSISNGSIFGVNTKINSGLQKIFDTTINLEGNWIIPEVYPQWFGAKGDGINDDSTAIQGAIDFASLSVSGFYGETTGRVVKFIAGVYNITKTIVIPNNAGIKLIGEGKTKSIIFSVNNDCDIFKVSGNNFRGGFYGLRLTSTQGTTYSIYKAINIENSGNQIDVEDCWINTIGYGIYCNPSSDSNFINNVFEYVFAPIYIQGNGSGYFTITNNTFYNVGPVAAGGQTYAESFHFSGQSIIFTNNRFTNDSSISSQDYFILCDSVSNFIYDNNVFYGDKLRSSFIKCINSNNIIISNSNFPLVYKGHLFIDTCSFVNINNCYFANSFKTQSNILLYFNNSNNISVINNNIGGNYSRIIGIKDCSIIDISSNIFREGTKTALESQLHADGSNNINICSNKFLDLDADTSNNNKSTSLASCLNLKVSDNYFTKECYIDKSCVAYCSSNNGTITYYNTPPIYGLWRKGDIVYNTDIEIGKPIGWICATGGTPGTWISLGNFS